MKKKINAKFMQISVLAIVVTAVCAMLLFYRILEKQIFDDLKANAHVISMMELENLSNEITYDMSADGLRITAVDKTGTVIYDSLENPENMENHSNRPEIVSAFQKGEGKSIRKSATSQKHTFYYAILTENGDVLRIAKESNSIYNFIVNMVLLIIVLGMLVFVLCMFYAHRLTGRLVSPIEKLADNIILVDADEVYPEIKPFVTMIKQQHMDILNHSQIRQEFTANVSHELKTPLTAISGYAELIANGMTNEADTAHFANEIHSSAERLQNLINDIIKLAELDDTDLKMEFETLDLYDMAENCEKMMTIPAQKNDVSIQVQGEHTVISGNKTLIEELVYNLCSNAVRYNKHGGSVIMKTYTENGKAVLSVKDTGIGIPLESQERIFERFYRVDKSRSKSTGGTGLGLAIVKHIVTQHEAEMELVSEVDVGTEIRIIFGK